MLQTHHVSRYLGKFSGILLSYEEVALESGDSMLRVTCTIKDVSITFSDEDFNKALELPEENLHPCCY